MSRLADAVSRATRGPKSALGVTEAMPNKVVRTASLRESPSNAVQRPKVLGMFSAATFGILTSMDLLNDSFLIEYSAKIAPRFRYSSLFSVGANAVPSASRCKDESVFFAICCIAASASGSCFRIDSSFLNEATALKIAFIVAFLSAPEGFRSITICSIALTSCLSFSVKFEVKSL